MPTQIMEYEWDFLITALLALATPTSLAEDDDEAKKIQEICNELLLRIPEHVKTTLKDLCMRFRRSHEESKKELEELREYVIIRAFDGSMRAFKEKSDKIKHGGDL